MKRTIARAVCITMIILSIISCKTTKSPSQSEAAPAPNETQTAEAIIMDNSEWQVVGLAGFTPGAAGLPKMLIMDSVVYACFADISDGWKAKAMKYSGYNWAQCGDDLSTGMAKTIGIKEFNGALYAVYGEGDDADRLSMKKYDGTSVWDIKGNTGFSAGLAQAVSIAIDGNVLYAGYIDGANSNRMSVKKFDGINWSAVGTDGFSDIVSGAVRLALLKGSLYVIYPDAENNSRVAAMKYNGAGAWVAISGSGVSDGQALGISVDTDDNYIYLAYRDNSALGAGRVTVKKFDGSIWQQLGDQYISDAASGSCFIKVGPYGIPYVAYSDSAHNYNVTVKKLSGSAFTVVGAPSFSPAISDAWGMGFIGIYPYVLMTDGNAGGKLTVMRFAP